MDANTAAYLEFFLKPKKAVVGQQNSGMLAQYSSEVVLDKKVYGQILNEVRSKLENTLLLEVPYEECKSQYHYNFSAKSPNVPVALFVYYQGGSIDKIVFWDSRDARPLVIYYEPNTTDWQNEGNVKSMVRDIANQSSHDMQIINKCIDMRKQKLEEEKKRRENEERKQRELYKGRVYEVKI